MESVLVVFMLPGVCEAEPVGPIDPIRNL